MNAKMGPYPLFGGSSTSLPTIHMSRLGYDTHAVMSGCSDVSSAVADAALVYRLPAPVADGMSRPMVTVKPAV